MTGCRDLLPQGLDSLSTHSSIHPSTSPFSPLSPSKLPTIPIFTFASYILHLNTHLSSFPPSSTSPPHLSTLLPLPFVSSQPTYVSNFLFVYGQLSYLSYSIARSMSIVNRCWIFGFLSLCLLYLDYWRVGLFACLLFFLFFFR